MPDMLPNIFIYYWRAATEIAILWFVIYQIMLFFEGSRAIHVLRGIVVLLLAFLIFQKLHFAVLGWLMQKLFGISIIAILVIFHPEIRQGLARLGKHHLFREGLKEGDLDIILKEVDAACENLARNKIGALIVIEKNDSLAGYAKNGVAIDSHISSDLLQAIFTPNNPLHDGAAIIQHNRILSAGCILPLTENPHISRMYGMRHRAALGLSEESDAIIIVVSEERLDVSLIYRGRLYRDLSRQELINKAKEIFRIKKDV